jgi:beta-carotene hydroxylase
MYFLLWGMGWEEVAAGVTIPLTFFTYGSISHDLVHRNLGLPRVWNEVFLSAIELLTFRSGHAYRVSHLHHHARFPAEDDLEGAAARMTWQGALADGLTLQARLWWKAARRPGPHRPWVLAEGAAGLALATACLAAWPQTAAPATYLVLMLAGSWTFPLVTSWIPHEASGTHALHQTRLFRGHVFSWLAADHLYHLEHHLFPQVPHHHWAKLARRLDPYFQRAGIQARQLWF